jgi:sugar phosphate isomerase/epimerase
MQLGFVSAILGELSLEDVLKRAAEMGYDCVELMCWPQGTAERRYAGVTHLDVTHFDDSQAAAVNGLCEKHGVSISGLGYYPNPLAPDPEESQVAVSQIERVIEAAGRIGVKRMNTFVGRDWTQNIETNWQRFSTVWPPIVEFAESHDVKIGIENCPMFFTEDEWPGGKNLATCPNIWRRMFDAIPSDHFGLNYDPSHLVWQHIDYIKPLTEFASRIFHVHAKDALVDYEVINDLGFLALPNQMHRPKLPGLGDVDWGRFISTLNNIGYRGPVCVEVEDRAFEDSLEQRYVALRQSLGYLRNYIARR